MTKEAQNRRFLTDCLFVKNLLAMRSHLMFILILFNIGFTQTSSLASNWMPKTEIDVTAIERDKGLIQSVEHQLLNHVWEVGHRTLLFKSQGTVSEVMNDRYACFESWEVFTEDGQAYLKLMNASQAVIYELSTNAMTWTGISDGIAMNVKATSIEHASARTAVMQSLMGTWSSTIYPSELLSDLTAKHGKSVQSADFIYKVRPDGTFAKILYLNGEAYQRMNGVWQLSSDGSYFILHFDKENGSYQTYIVKVKHLSLDELVIDQALVTSAVEHKLCGEMDTFFFSKR